jgi:hypothetical protein
MHARTDPGKVIGEHADRLTVRVPLRRTACRHHHAERGDKRRQARVTDQRTINKPTDKADRKTRENRPDHWQTRQRRIDGARVTGLLREAGRDHRGHRHHGARRQIDAARNDHLRDANGDDPDHGHLQNHHFEPVRIEQKTLPVHKPAQRFKEKSHTHEHQKNARFRRPFAAPTRRGCATCMCLHCDLIVCHLRLQQEGVASNIVRCRRGALGALFVLCCVCIAGRSRMSLCVD